jgi:CRISPR-associated protein Cas2
MKKQKKRRPSFVEQMMAYKKAGLSHSGRSRPLTAKEQLADLPVRVKKILDIAGTNTLKATEMLYFIMYDIENNKVRTAIAKYLEKNGCLRVQKSIFFANSEREKFNKIHKDLKHIQELYDNDDSIFMVPVSTDQVRAMKITGSNTGFDIITGNKNTLFF